MPLVNSDGQEIRQQVPAIKGVHPTGSKVLIEVLKAAEIMNTSLYVGDDTKVEGCPQAYIIELGPGVAVDSGLAVGQRVYWDGKGVAIEDPRAQNGRVRALLEISNIKAIIEE